MYSIVKTVKINYPTDAKNDNINIVMKNANNHELLISTNPKPPVKSFKTNILKELNKDYGFYNIERPIKKHDFYTKSVKVERKTLMFEDKKNEKISVFNAREIEDKRDLEQFNNKIGPGHQYSTKGIYALTGDIKPSIYKIITNEIQFEKL